MRAHKNMKFYNLSLHPFAESGETQWAFLDLTPRGSLLEWIDNFLSDPKTEADLTLGKWDNVILASHLIPLDVRSRIVLRSFNAGERGEPQQHGDFDEFDFWTPEFRGEVRGVTQVGPVKRPRRDSRPRVTARAGLPGDSRPR